jgi:outer membrane protein assembly factor BamD (BamD/ComL family)
VQETVPAVITAPAAGVAIEPGVILQRAKETFDEGNAAAAIALLDQFREYYPSGGDELYWLYGQFYEANTPGRNILLALDYYRRLVNEYPQSSRYNDARRRIAYLERFYINIQ